MRFDSAGEGLLLWDSNHIIEAFLVLKATSDSPTSTKFRKVKLPTGEARHLPADVTVKFPEPSLVASDRLHLLAYIPWHNKYLAGVPDGHRDFFRFVLPSLGARTTNVHTALSASFVPQLVAATEEAVDEGLAVAATILHDSGWAQMGHDEIANSLDYSALSYSNVALEPKRKHAVLGSEVARKLLDQYDFGGKYSEAQKDLIARIVLYHDQVNPWDVALHGEAPTELKLVGDADRLWSYTHENFWLDTVRKHVEPIVYVTNLAMAMETFFLTEQGKAIAKGLILEREAEVAELVSVLDGVASRSVGRLSYA
jgi:hypothetical protein